MKSDFIFEIGQKYENRKGTYEVITIDGDSMTILWESGEEIITTVRMQQRIIKGMNTDCPQLNLNSDLGKIKAVKQYVRTPDKDNIDRE